MAFTYNPATDIGKVRLLIMDTVEAGHIFEDDEIQAFLDMNEQILNLAAADALISIATNRALLGRRIKVLDIDVDTREAAASLLSLSDRLRALDDGSFEIAELVTNPFSARERLWKQWERGGL